MSSSGSNAGMEMTASLVNGIVNNALFHSTPHINQTLHQNMHILHFCLVDSLQNYAPEVAVSWIYLVRAVRQPQIRKFIGVTTIS